MAISNAKTGFLAAALAMAVNRHEQAFGLLETDVQRRIVPQKS